MHLLRSIASACLIVLLAACASGPAREISLGSAEYGFHNAGLVVGRAPARGDKLLGWKGLAVNVRNDETKAQFSTGSGLSGYTSSEYFAIWLPPGSYTVTSVFAYNGGVEPVDEPFRFVVKPGAMIYIGTLVNSWDMPPQGIEGLGRVLAVKRHARRRCPLILSCQQELGPPFAQVVLLDEGSGFARSLKAAVPDLPDVALERWFMW